MAERKLAGKLMNFGRILAIDLGEKRCGIAVSDELLITVRPLKRVSSENLAEEIRKLNSELSISTIVFGIPLNEDGTIGDFAKKMVELAQQVRGESGGDVPWLGFDEYLSTEEAFAAGADESTKDSFSAAVLLRSVLDELRTSGLPPEAGELLQALMRLRGFVLALD